MNTTMDQDTVTPVSQLEDVRNHIFCRTANQSELPKAPRDIPFERHADLVVTYYIQTDDQDGNSIIPLTNRMVSDLKLKTDQMRELAWRNTMTKKRAILQSLSQIFGEEETDPPLYVLTNEEMYLGAVTMFYPGLLDLIADKLDSDLCILPSSIHECLILPADRKTDWEGLKKIVERVNATEVDEADILSNHVYRYNRGRKALSIDNT